VHGGQEAGYAFRLRSPSCGGQVGQPHYELGRNRPRSSAARLVAHNDIYLVVQSVQAANQTIDREFADATGDKRRNIRLLETEHGSRLGLGKLPAFENSADFANKLGLEKLSFRIGKPKVGKDIAAARGYFLGLLISCLASPSAFL
jgi:hypothetical protein